MNKNNKVENWHEYYKKQPEIRQEKNLQKEKENLEHIKKPKNVFFSGFFNWKITNKDLLFQVNNYSDLKPTQSYKWATVNITLFFLFFSLLSSVITGESIDGAFLLLAIYIPILIFIVRGDAWATIVLIIIWTAGKVFAIYINYPQSSHIIYGIIFLWWMITPFFYKNLLVESRRKSILKNKQA